MSRKLPLNDPYKLSVASKIEDLVVYTAKNDHPVYYPKLQGVSKNGK